MSRMPISGASGTMNEAAEFENLGEGGGDRIQSLAIVIPCYHHVPTKFFCNYIEVTRPLDDYEIVVTEAVYLPQAMRHALEELKDKEWERLVVIEQDMILPKDALLKHALHTDDIVGSVYFQHAPPYALNCMFADPTNPERMGTPRAPLVKAMLTKPALYKCASVGMGCTSIARRVFENWDKNLPYFRTDYVGRTPGEDDEAQWKFAHGEVSHDVWFCKEAIRQGFEVFLDTSIHCDHLTEGWVNANHYMTANAEELKALEKILKPGSKEFYQMQKQIKAAEAQS